MPSLKKKLERRKEEPHFFRRLADGGELARWSRGIFADPAARWLTAGWLMPLVLIIVTAIVLFSRLPREIPLFYGRPWGEAQLAARAYIFLPAISALVLGAVNFAFAAARYEQEKLLAFFLLLAAVLIGMLSIITTAGIIYLVY
jgi:hypothetical protein